MSAPKPAPAASKRSLFSLVGDLPRIVSELVRAEIESFQAQLTGKAKAAGVGVGLIVVAVGFLLFALGAFVTAAIAAIALALPLWASALIVGGGLTLIAAILVVIGIVFFKRLAATPGQIKESVEADIRVIKGTEIPGKDF